MSADDAAEAFTALLDETARKHAAIAAAEWDGVLGLIVFDKRYGQVKTLAQRKALFEAWRRARSDESSAARAERLKPARDAFVAMVVGCAELDGRSAYSRAEQLLGSDARWVALDANARRDAFEDTVDDRRRAGARALAAAGGTRHCARP